jgi:Amt family ammonium transporter
MPGADSGDTAWMLASAAFVLFMIPGLALFYGGMVRSKSVLNMMLMSFGALFLVAVLWVLYGYSEAFGSSYGGLGLVGDVGEFLGLTTVMSDNAISGTIPTSLFVAFQLMFAGLTVALISGAIADRARFGAWMLFAGIWASVVYFPVAHWVFAFDTTDAAGNLVSQGGWIANSLGGWVSEGTRVIDFAGGTAVHINAGAAALALALVLGRRIGFGRTPTRPHNLTLVMLGSGILWFGWYGFNAGSALAAGTTASVVFLNTTVATAGGALAWLLVEHRRDGHATTLGAASGVVAGLVAITPACSAVSPLGAIAIGTAAGSLCALAVGLKYRLGYDDSLDVVGVHLVGGLVGTVLIGVVATAAAPAGTNGLLYGGGPAQLVAQTIAALTVAAFSFAATYLIGTAIHKTMGFRVTADEEQAGIDQVEHAETAYDFDDIVGGGRGGTASRRRILVDVPSPHTEAAGPAAKAAPALLERDAPEPAPDRADALSAFLSAVDR